MGGRRSKGRFNNNSADYWLKPFTGRPLATSPFTWLLVGSNGYELELTNIGADRPHMIDMMNLILRDPEPWGDSARFRVIGGKPKRTAVKFTADELANYRASLNARA